MRGGAFLPHTICGARSARRARRACRPYGRTSARSSLADRGARGASRRARPSRRARADDDARPGPFFFGSPRSCDRNASVWFSCSDFWTCDFQVWVSVTHGQTHALKGVRVGVPPSTKLSVCGPPKYLIPYVQLNYCVSYSKNKNREKVQLSFNLGLSLLD